MERIQNNPVYKFIRSNLVLVAIVLLVIVTVVAQPNFLSGPNLNNIIRQFGPLSFVALGMTFVIVGGFIDLSVSGIISLVVIITMSLIDVIGQFPAILVGIAVGVVAGYVNSLIILSCGALTSAEALFITFGMSLVYGALALLLAGGNTTHLSSVASSITIFEFIGKGSIGFISVSFLIFLVFLAILYVYQKKTFMGRSVNLTGGNKTAAALSGIPVRRTIKLIYTISGLMSAIGAIMLFARVTTASPVIGKNFETNAILAVVVGGTSLKGGDGSVLRTVLGVLLVTLMSNCLNLLGVDTFMQVILKGAILVIAIWLDNRR